MGVKGLMSEGWEFIRTKSADMADEVKRYAEGLRGQAKPAVDPAAEATRSPRVGPNPNVGPGRPSAEAKAYLASKTAVAPTAKAPSRMAQLGKLGGAVALGVEGVRAAPTLADSDVPMTEKVREGARGLIRGGMTVLGGAGGAVLGSAIPGPGTIAGGIGGGAAGYAAGDYLAEQVLGPSRIRDSRVIPAAQARPIAPTPVARPSAVQGKEDNLIDTTRGLRVTPEAMIGGNAVPVEGQGAFKVGSRPAQKVGARSDALRIGNNPAALPQAKGLAGHMVNLSALGLQAKAAAVKEAGAAKEAELGIKSTTARASLAKASHDIGKDNEARLDKDVENEVRRFAPAMGLTDSKEGFESGIKKQTAELSARIAHSAANRGIERADLKPTQVRQLALANRIREAVNNERSSLSAGFRDFFGNKRFDSDDLFNYLPEVKDGKVHFGGNSMPVEEVLGGKFNLFSPNDPVNRDFLELVQAAIAKSKKGK